MNVFLSEGNKLTYGNDFSAHEKMKGELKLWGDSVNLLKARGVQKILDNLKGEGKVSPAEEQKLKYYHEVERQFNDALANVNAMTPKIRELRDRFTEQDTLVVDTTASTGTTTRYESVAGRLKTPLLYPDRTDRDTVLLVYDSEPLDKDMEVTGHAEVVFYLASSSADAQLFVYLEDVAPNGNVEYVTEGLFRGIHRKKGEGEPPYNMTEPYHTYLKEDAMPLVPDEVVELNFGMLPVSYLFRKGHRLRIAVSGADAEHYRNMTGDAPTYVIQRSFKYPSRVKLPVITR